MKKLLKSSQNVSKHSPKNSPSNKKGFMSLSQILFEINRDKKVFIVCALYIKRLLEKEGRKEMRSTTGKRF